MQDLLLCAEHLLVAATEGRLPHVVDWNHFKDFSVDVTGQAGADHFEIQSTGMDQHTVRGEISQTDILDHYVVELEQKVIIRVGLVLVDRRAVEKINILGSDADRQLGVCPRADVNLLSDVDVTRRCRCVEPLLLAVGEAGNEAETSRAGLPSGKYRRTR